MAETPNLLSSSTLHQALEVLAEGVVIADTEGRFVLFNKAAERILGIGSLGSDPESWPRDYGLFSPDGQTPCSPEEVPLTRALAGEDSDNVEMFVRNANRPEGIFIRVSGRPIRSDSGEILGGVVIFRDVTELREKQEALVTANHSLEESNSSLQDFVSVASHDLRGPLAAVLGFASTMQKTWENLKDEDKLHYTQIIERQARSAMALCEDLLTLSRIQAGDLRAHPEDLRVRRAITDAVEGISDPDGQITIDCPDDLEVRCDPQHLERILNNYLTNSLRYGAPPVTVSAKGDDLTVTIEVKDSGPGVPESVRGRLFERFARGENAVTGSTGLGLSIVRGLAESNGGNAYYDDSGPGSNFVVTLPRA